MRRPVKRHEWHGHRSLLSEAAECQIFPFLPGVMSVFQQKYKAHNRPEKGGLGANLLLLHVQIDPLLFHRLDQNRWRPQHGGRERVPRFSKRNDWRPKRRRTSFLAGYVRVGMGRA